MLQLHTWTIVFIS